MKHAPRPHKMDDVVSASPTAAFETVVAILPTYKQAAHVVPFLADPDRGVRERAAHIIEAHGGTEAAIRIAEYITSKDITIRNLAGDVLTRLGESAYTALIPWIDHPDHDARKFAIDLLALMGAQPCADLIGARLEDQDANVRLAAIDALAALNARHWAESIRELYDREAYAQPNVIAALGVFQHPEDVAFLESALLHNNPVVQLAAVEALAPWNIPAVYEALLRKIEVVSEMARPVLAASIIQQATSEQAALWPPQVRTTLVAMLNDLDPEYQRIAVAGLGKLQDDDVVHQLVSAIGRSDALDHEIYNVIRECTGVLSVVLEHIESCDIEPQVGAEFVLALLGQVYAFTAEADEEALVISFFEKHYYDLNLETRMAAVTVAEQLDDELRACLIKLAKNDVELADHLEIDF